jgi:hypothetical protein
MLQGISQTIKFVFLLGAMLSLFICPTSSSRAEENKEDPSDHPPAPGTPMPFQTQVPPAVPPAAEDVPQDNLPAPEKPKPQPHAIDLVIKKGRVNKKTSSTGVQETYQFSVEIKNKEPVRVLNEVQVNLYVLGRDVKDRTLYNLINHSLNVFTIAPQAVDTLESSAFYLRYTKSSGTEYDGYLITIDDKEGHRLLTKSTNRRFEDNLDLIRAAKVSKTKTNSFRLK